MELLKEIVYFEKAPSSQDIIKENIPFYLNQIVHVDHQLSGYGTFKKPWVSSLNDLTFSYLIKKELSHKEMLIKESLILYETLGAYHRELYIKPPNDIYTKTGKLAGILIEEITHENQIYWVVGIGVNRTLKPSESFKSDALESKGSKEDILRTFIHNHNNFKTISIIDRYLKIVSKTPLMATYKNSTSLVTEIDHDLNVYTKTFKAPLEWVTFNPIFE